MKRWYLTIKVGLFSLLLLMLLLSACTSNTQQDSGPPQPLDVSHIPDAVPRAEVRTLAGNKSPYNVLGKTYRVRPDSRGFVQEGIASWYGNKFHGRQTSNGEIYSMYGMTAAHKTLPIPCYVRVTNLQNNRQIVVRVNDRGPFHDGRIIDLTYAGASKLGFLKQGTAPVKIEVLEPEDGGSEAETPAHDVVIRPAEITPVVSASGQLRAPTPAHPAGYQLPANTYLQAGAFSNAEAAQRVRDRVASLTSLPVFIAQRVNDDLYRVRIGPIIDNRELMNVRSRMEAQSLPSPHVIYN